MDKLSTANIIIFMKILRGEIMKGIKLMENSVEFKEPSKLKSKVF